MLDNVFGAVMLLFAVVGAFVAFGANRRVNELTRTVRAQRNRLNRMQDQLDTLRTHSGTDSEGQDEPEAAAVEEAFAEPTVAESTDEAEAQPDIEPPVQAATSETPDAIEPPPILPAESRPAFTIEDPEPSLQEKLVAKLNIPVDKSTEEIIFSYVLPRLGVLGIAIGVFIFMAFFASQTGPLFKILSGYGVAAGLLVLGKWSETKQPK